MSRVEIVLATMNQNNLDVATEMNIHSPAMITNQCGQYDYDAVDAIRMLSTSSRGVGINRNIGLLLAKEDILMFADDDIVYYNDYEDKILRAFDELSDADVIIFGIEMFKDGKKVDTYLTKTEKIGVLNALKYGTYSVAVRRKSIKMANIHFTTEFGGGSTYGSGEDSLFILDCLKAGLRVYTHEAVIAKNLCKASTWFTGYDEKYFYDKGAWLACAFPKIKRIVEIYFALRFTKITNLSLKTRVEYMNAGMRGFRKLISYQEWKNSRGGN